jgi:AraC-like DNA-binding protein
MTTQALGLDAALDELAALIARSSEGAEGLIDTPVPGLAVSRATAQGERVHSVYTPFIGVIAKGRKRIVLADEVFLYDRAHFVAAAVDLPVTAQVLEASPEKPYLGIKLEVSMQEIAALMLEMPPKFGAEAPAGRAMLMSRVDAELVDAFIRMLRLVQTPEDVPVLEPGIRREILYRVLKSEQGFRLRQLVSARGHTRRIAAAIEWLRRNFRQPLRIEELAAQASMSPSSFHEHFRAATAMSPLQFQKQLRLQEARQLLISEALDAATVGHRVGYESPSQFSREYSRLFGAPPAADRKRLASAGEVI